MNSNFHMATRCRRGFRGLTRLEFLGCAIAVVGGAYLGAMYLGVDLHKVAFTALSQSKLIDKVPAELRPANPDEQVMTREEVVAALHEELGSLRNEITALRAGTPSGQGESAKRKDASPNDLPPTKEKTLAYWQRLNEIAIGEAALQRDTESAFNTNNAAKVFAIKGRISRFSAKAVEAVPTQEVDEAMIKFGRQLQLWYDRAGELYEKAVRIWETPIAQQARNQLNLEWKRADEQHRNEGRLISEKARAVRGSMSRIYGIEFPEFDKATATSASTEFTAKSG